MPNRGYQPTEGAIKPGNPPQGSGMPKTKTQSNLSEESQLRINALEMALRYAPNAASDSVIRDAERFYTFLSGKEPTYTIDQVHYMFLQMFREMYGSASS